MLNKLCDKANTALTKETFIGAGAVIFVRLFQCHWSCHEIYGRTILIPRHSKHCKAQTVCFWAECHAMETFSALLNLCEGTCYRWFEIRCRVWYLPSPDQYEINKNRSHEIDVRIGLFHCHHYMIGHCSHGLNYTDRFGSAERNPSRKVWKCL